ncbi:MAG: hypothetical protein ABIQ06_15470 [Caldimonas sp.]
MGLLQALKLPLPNTLAAGGTASQRPAQGQIGHVAPYKDQGPAGQVNGQRVTEHEHVIPRGKQQALTRDPATGRSDYTKAHYKNNTALRVERETALNKTHANRGGPNADNTGTDRLKAKSNRNDPKDGINYRDEVFTDSVDNMKRAARATNSGVTDAQINEAALAQDGELFAIQRMKDTRERLGATKAEVDSAVESLDFGDDDDAAALRASIDASRRKAREKLVRVQEIATVLDKKIAATSGAEKRALIANRALLKNKSDEAVGAIERADADLEAVANPASRREDLVAIRARHGSRASMAPTVEVDVAGLEPSGKSTSRDQTTTTTSLDKGRATVEKVRSADRLGADGWTSTRTRDRELTGKNLVARSSEERRTHVSLTGKAAIEEKQSQEVELADGRTAGIESRTSKEIGPGGASKTETVEKKAFDGSSTSTTHKQGIERGDGKVTATKSRSVTETDASGTAVTREGSVAGGIVADKGAMGVHGNAKAGKKVASREGMQAGVVGGLHANVVCEVGEPTGNPKRYRVSLTVSFGGSIAVSGGAGKKAGSKASAGMEVRGSLEKSMTVTHMLGEAELGDYVKSLEAASKGSQVAATFNEFAIISAGAKANDWSVARNLWQGISKSTADSLKHAGDSIEVSEKKGTGVAVHAEAGPVGAGYAVRESDETSTTMTRDDHGNLDVDGKGAHTTEESLSGSLSAGVAGLTVGTTHTQQTRFGFAIEIDPNDDPDGSMIAALAKCEKKAEYKAFLAKHPKARLVSKTEGKSDAERTETGVELFGVKVMGLSTRQGIDEDVKTDATGKVLSRRVAGHAGAGGNLGPLADSVEEDAVAESDGEGNASLTMTRTYKDNYGGRARDKQARKLVAKLGGTPKAGEKASGLLTAMAGGDDDDSATHDVSGIILTNKDLRRLGGVASRSALAWMGVLRRVDEKQDWLKAGIAIKKAGARPSVVAEQLARFVGGDRVERMKTVELFIRGGYQQTTGKAFEFPDSLREVQDDYNLVTDDGLADNMNAYATQNGAPAAAEECQRLVTVVDRVHARIQPCKEFNNNATKMEMLQQLVLNRVMLVRGIKGYGGDLQANNDPRIIAEYGDRLMKQCNDYFTEQTRLTKKMQNQETWTVSDRSAGRRLIKQLEDLHHRWWDDWARLRDNYMERKLTLPDLPSIKPQEELVATFEKKFQN